MENEARRERTVISIDYSMRSIAGISWLVWGLVSAGISAVWIPGRAGFGTWLDLLGCFLWGLGMNSLGACILALTPGSVATFFRVKLPQ